MGKGIMHKKIILICLALCHSMLFALAESGSVFLPARFADGGNGFLTSFKFVPEDSDFSAAAFCEAKASAKGELINPKCMVTQWEHTPFKKAVQSQLRHFKVTPATVSGDPVDVSMKLMVGYYCKKSQCQGLVTLNNAHLKDQYGLNYIAPQLILNNRSKPYLPGAVYYKRSVKMSAKVMVDNQGVPTDVEELQVGPDYKRWFRYLKKRLPEDRYIPGIYQAEYVAMPYTYVFWVD